MQNRLKKSVMLNIINQILYINVIK